MPPVQLYLHTYSLRFHLVHQPGFDVFAFIERAAEGFVGVCISANDAHYRHLGGKEPARMAAIRAHLQAHKLACDMDTSGTEQLRTYTRYTLTGEPPLWPSAMASNSRF